jgi:BspA type Leucine rich repeat region (6 copies)
MMNQIKNLLIIGCGILVFIITGLYISDHSGLKPVKLEEFEFMIDNSHKSNECKITGISGYRKEVVIPAQSKDCNITEVTFGGYPGKSPPKSLNTIEKVMFEEDSQVEVIGPLAFQGTKIAHINIHDSVKVINEYAFADTEIQSLYIPENIRDINFAAFEKMDLLKEIIVDPNNPHYTSSDGVLFSKDQSRLIKYPNAKEDKSYAIPDGVVTLDLLAITENKYIESLTIPNTVHTLGSINYNENLKSIHFEEGIHLITLDNDAINNAGVFGYNPKLEKIIIPKSVKEIGNRTFIGNRSMTSIQFEEGSQLTTIGAEAFKKTALNEVTIPKTVLHINYQAFANIEELTTVKFEEGSQLEVIGQGAFYGYNNSNIKSIEVPKSVVEIGDYAFANLLSLETFIFEEGSQLNTLNTWFISNTKVKTLSIPDTVSQLNSESFYYLKHIETIIFTSITPPNHQFGLFGYRPINTPIPIFYVPNESIEAYQASFEGYEITILGIDSLDSQIIFN